MKSLVQWPKSQLKNATATSSVLAEPSNVNAYGVQFAPVIGTQEASPDGIGVIVKTATGGALLIVSVAVPPVLATVERGQLHPGAALISTNLVFTVSIV